ncbi:MAG: hypothetical protein HQ515_11400 [Phycisphaeraceae bacterium]|nr:hypothetical protein [Phycisphaeraceae bacterium]
MINGDDICVHHDQIRAEFLGPNRDEKRERNATQGDKIDRGSFHVRLSKETNPAAEQRLLTRVVSLAGLGRTGCAILRSLQERGLDAPMTLLA